MGDLRKTACSLAALALLPALAWASDFGLGYSEPVRFYVGGGLLSQYAGAMTTTTSGTKVYTAATYTQLSVMGHLGVLPLLTVTPIFSITPFGHKSPDGHTKAMIYMLAARGSYLFNDVLEVSLGPGAMFYKVSGDGAIVTQQNGSSTADFGVPPDSQTSRTFYWNLGAGLLVQRFRLDLDALVSGTFNSAKRATTIMLTASVGLL